MKDEEINVFARNFLAVIAGVLCAIGVGAVLYPLVEMVFKQYFSPVDIRQDNSVLLLTMIAWLFISSLTGGIICTLISLDKEQVYSSISSLVCLAVFYIIPEIRIFEATSWQAWVLLITIPLGSLTGSWIGAWLKKRKRRVA